MKKQKAQKKTPSHRRKKSSPRKKAMAKSHKATKNMSAEIKAFSKHILQDYALPLKRIVEQKITRLQHRFA